MDYNHILIYISKTVTRAHEHKGYVSELFICVSTLVKTTVHWFTDGLSLGHCLGGQITLVF